MVKFETITGREVELNVNPNTTLGEIKRMLAEQYKWDIQKIHLLFDGSEQQNNTKLSTINLENGKRFIVIYVEPSGIAPDVEDMLSILEEYNPDRQLRLEALQKNNYNIEQASEYLLNKILDSTSSNPSNNSNASNNKTVSAHQDGKQVKPDNNPFVYTPEKDKNSNNKNKSNPFGLTDDEVKNVLAAKTPQMDDAVAFELFIEANKDINLFKSFFQ